MNFQELVKKHTKDGNTDWEAVNKEAQADIEKQIGAVSAKTAAKYKAKIEELSKGAEKKDDQNQDPSGIIAQMQKQIEELKTQSERSSQITEFKAKAKELNVDNNLVENLINSGADLTKFDLDPFKGKEVKKLSTKEDDSDDNDKSAEQEAEAKAALEEALKINI